MMSNRVKLYLRISQSSILSTSMNPLKIVLLTMASIRIRLTIITKYGKLIGVFTYLNACRSFGEYQQAKIFKANGNDNDCHHLGRASFLDLHICTNTLVDTYRRTMIAHNSIWIWQ